jgi:nicotinamidase-related amidase
MAGTYQIPVHWDMAQDKKIDRCSTVWRVPYNVRANEAEVWARKNNINPASTDHKKSIFMLIDNQNTFCLPDFELYVAGQNGNGAVEDSARITDFIYKNLGNLSAIAPTLDTHVIKQIFHPMLWVNKAGDHPAGGTPISHDDVVNGVWGPSMVANELFGNNAKAVRYFLHYTKTLESNGKYALMVWPYHAMLGGVGHAIVSAVEEAIFFHACARQTQPDYRIKGGNPRTENYSVLDPEVKVDEDGRPIAQRDMKFIETLLRYDTVIIAGQAKSHCVAWTIADLLQEINTVDPTLAKKVVLLDDCSSPVVIPNVIDFTQQAEDAYAKFAAAGMRIRKSTDPMDTW